MTEFNLQNTIAPSQNILIGSRAIMAYIGVRSIVTLYQWVERYGFPAIKRPDGRWMSSVTAIDNWIFIGAGEDYRQRGRSRGSNARADLALAIAVRQFGEESIQAQYARDRVARVENLKDTTVSAPV